MKYTLQDRLLRRELGYPSRYVSVSGLYGDRAWVDNLDIVNELGGHSGCVNALSWSRTGTLLASGSDDQHLNIHSYQPNDSITPFSLTTTITTGHTANIFSVKFMPHSNDNTLVSCAGDGEIRVFDIDYSGRSIIPSAASNLARVNSSRRRRFNNIYRGVRYLSDGDTNARIYRSHSQRVKRIVTESSPYLFLSCSEDGEVRQWDLRLPSSAYPAPYNGHGSGDRHRHNIPPPLISYKRYHLDLNTISCSATQPHYIALGGAHLHCFLHDRRMIGRDLLKEKGNPGFSSPANNLSENDDESMGQATKCVRRFAPRGQTKMSRTENGHITACKISDANPNEMIVSWSGDHIYSFDLVKSPPAAEKDSLKSNDITKGSGKGKAKESGDRKRKRKQVEPSISAEDVRRAVSHSRTFTENTDGDGDLALRVRYENGQSEDISIEQPDPEIETPLSTILDYTREAMMSDSERKAEQIAKYVVKMRKEMFSLDASVRSDEAVQSQDLSSHHSRVSKILRICATALSAMDEIMRDWAYPIGPDELDIRFQMTLRRNRDSTRRFVQAAGVLARVLGGELRQTSPSRQSSRLPWFHHVCSSPIEGRNKDERNMFSYAFLNAILTWLDGGREALVQGFKQPRDQRNDILRYPVPDAADQEAIDDHIIPFLLRMARNRIIPNVDASRFEVDASRRAFETETAAVIAFSHAIRVPLQDMSRAIMAVSSSADGTIASVANFIAQDRSAAMKFWGFKVGRGLLMNAGEGVNFAFVNHAFGGLAAAPPHEDEERVQEEIDVDEPENPMRSISVVSPVVRESSDTMMEGTEGNHEETEHEASDTPRSLPTPPTHSRPVFIQAPPSEEEDEEVILVDDLHDELADHIHSITAHGPGSDSSDSSDADDDIDSDDDITAEERQFVWQSASARGKLRESVAANVPCMPHFRQYRGHCNIKTVKDVNYFGLQDEYVVSGSDCGNVFIWDRRTGELANILEGDGEVVNVVQGHPYEPLLAVSGIDHTIKIFSPDHRAQYAARQGQSLDVNATGLGGHSTLFPWGRERPRRYADTPASPGTDSDNQDDGDYGKGERVINEWENTDDEVGEQGLESRRRMNRSYEIVAQNDVDRQSGVRDAFITRGMLAQLAARLHARGAGGVGATEGMDPVVLDDNCAAM